MKLLIAVHKYKEHKWNSEDKEHLILSAFHTKEDGTTDLYDFDGEGEDLNTFPPIATWTNEQKPIELDLLEADNKDVFTFWWENDSRLPRAEEIQSENITFFL